MPNEETGTPTWRDPTYFQQLGRETSAAMTAKAAAGGWNGKAPLGYRKALTPDGEPSVEPDPDAAPLVREVFEMAAGGRPIRRILDELTAMGLRSKSGGRLLRSGRDVLPA